MGYKENLFFEFLIFFDFWPFFGQFSAKKSSFSHFGAKFGRKLAKNDQKSKNIKNSKNKFSLYPKMLVKSRKLGKISKMGESSIILKEISKPKNPYIFRGKSRKIAKYVPTSASHISTTVCSLDSVKTPYSHNNPNFETSLNEKKNFETAYPHKNEILRGTKGGS